MLWKENFRSYKLYARPEAKISPRAMISVVSQYVISFTCHNESMLIRSVQTKAICRRTEVAVCFNRRSWGKNA